MNSAAISTGLTGRRSIFGRSAPTNSMGAPNSTGRPLALRAIGKAAVALISLAALSACSTINLDRQFPTRDSRDLLGVGLGYIDRAFVEQLDIADVAVAGIGALSTVDSQFSARRGTKGLITQYGSSAREYPVSDPTSASAWARATNSALIAVRNQSSTLASASTAKLYRVIFEGYEDRLDQFSRYLEPDEATSEDDRFLGFGGIGINIDNEPQGIRVVNVMRRSPADKGGLKKGDLIVAVNGQRYAPNRPLKERSIALKGPIGSRVNLTVQRGLGRRLQTFDLTRAEVVSESVELDLKDDVAFLRILTFNKNTAPRVSEAIAEALRQQQIKRRPLKGVVFDVRDNGGGLRTAVVEMADVVMSEGTITKTKGRINRANRTFTAEGTDQLKGLPIIVQINEGSASASELLAAALQDNARALVIGSTSFGKGSVQSKLPLPNRGELALTTARFFAPSGAPLHEYGVVPTLCTSDNTLAPQALLSEVFAGRRTLASAQARRALNQSAQVTKTQYRAYCPPSAASPDRDDDLAALILSRPEVYSALIAAYARDSR